MYQNEWLIYVLGGIIAAVIFVMSAVFLVKALKRAKAIGMSSEKVKKTITASAVFSIVPSIPIVIGIGIMMQYLGLAIPWIRLTVIGALQYEITAMYAVGVTSTATTTLMATAVAVMTIAILAGPLFNALFYKKYQNKLMDLQTKNAKKMDTITGALLSGMLAGIITAIVVGGAFMVGSPTTDNSGITTYGEITLITLAASVVIMGICGVILVVFKQKWIESYALPLTILGAMAVAYLFIPVFA